MPRIDHAALWVSNLAGARDFYVGWFAGRSNGEYHNPATGGRCFHLYVLIIAKENKRIKDFLSMNGGGFIFRS